MGSSRVVAFDREVNGLFDTNISAMTMLMLIFHYVPICSDSRMGLVIRIQNSSFHCSVLDYIQSDMSSSVNLGLIDFLFSYGIFYLYSQI